MDLTEIVLPKLRRYVHPIFFASRASWSPTLRQAQGDITPYCPDGEVFSRLVVEKKKKGFTNQGQLADAFAEATINPNTTVLVTTNAMNKVAATQTGTLARLEAAGVLVLQGVCWYIMDPVEMGKQFGWKRLVTNSAKLVNIIKAHGYEPILRRTNDCVEAAIRGRLP